jgi:hypothetical protein
MARCGFEGAECVEGRELVFHYLENLIQQWQKFWFAVQIDKREYSHTRNQSIQIF